MAKKTRAEILTEINTLLADNTSGDISAEDVRSVLTDIKDSFVNLSDAGITTAEAAFLAGVTSAIQTQLDSKQAKIDAANRLNANLVGNGSVDNTEFSYINGVTSAIQTQLNAKANLSGATFDGAVTIGDYTLPTTDGTIGQVLKTDGDGSVTWQSQDYKEALLYITQTGTNAPTITTTIKNDFGGLVFSYIEEGQYGFNSDEDLTIDTFAQFSNGKNLEGTLIQTLLPNNGTIIVRISESSIGNLANANNVLEGYLYIRKYN